MNSYKVYFKTTQGIILTEIVKNSKSIMIAIGTIRSKYSIREVLSVVKQSQL